MRSIKGFYWTALKFRRSYKQSLRLPLQAKKFIFVREDANRPAPYPCQIIKLSGVGNRKLIFSGIHMTKSCVRFDIISSPDSIPYHTYTIEKTTHCLKWLRYSFINEILPEMCVKLQITKCSSRRTVAGPPLIFAWPGSRAKRHLPMAVSWSEWLAGTPFWRKKKNKRIHQEEPRLLASQFLCWTLRQWSCLCPTGAHAMIRSLLFIFYFL